MTARYRKRPIHFTPPIYKFGSEIISDLLYTKLFPGQQNSHWKGLGVKGEFTRGPGTSIAARSLPGHLTDTATSDKIFAAILLDIFGHSHQRASGNLHNFIFVLWSIANKTSQTADLLNKSQYPTKAASRHLIQPAKTLLCTDEGLVPRLQMGGWPGHVAILIKRVKH